MNKGKKMDIPPVAAPEIKEVREREIQRYNSDCSSRQYTSTDAVSSTVKTHLHRAKPTVLPSRSPRWTTFHAAWARPSLTKRTVSPEEYGPTYPL